MTKKEQRPTVLLGKTCRVKTGCGYLYTTTNSNNDGLPCEMFVRIGKSGGCIGAMAELTGRLASLALQAGVPIESIMETARGIACHHPFGTGDEIVNSCADAVAHNIQKYLEAKKKDAG